LRAASAAAQLDRPAKVALTNFPGKCVEFCPMLADIVLYGWFCLSRIDGYHPNLVN
jgi:hypothetical protein